MKQPASIFNDVIGPVMVGPSSSHTAGPARIGRMAGQLVAGSLRKITIIFDPLGSFAATYRGQRSDVGFVGGLLGWETDHSGMGWSLSEAGKRGIGVSVVCQPLTDQHPNAVQLRLIDDQARETVVAAVSLGGGIIEIREINGFTVSLSGDYFETLVLSEAGGADIQAIAAGLLAEAAVPYEACETVFREQKGLLDIKSRHKIPAEAIDNIKAKLDNVIIWQIEPVLPVLSQREAMVPFETATEMAAYLPKGGGELWQLAVLYEKRRSGWTQSEIFQRMDEIVAVMQAAGGVSHRSPPGLFPSRPGMPEKP